MGMNASNRDDGTDAVAPGDRQIGPWRPALRQADAQVRKLDRRIQRLIGQGKHFEAKRLTRLKLNSRQAMHSALRASNRRSAPAVRLKERELINVASSASPWHPSEEFVRVLAMRKSSGAGERVVHAYGIRNRASQIMVRDALRPFVVIDERLFLNRGRDAAVQTAVEMIREHLWRWVIHLDIKEFYPTIDKGSLASILPIAERIANVVITSEHVRHQYTYPRCLHGLSTRLHATTARRGLPQGAITSPLVADALLTYLFKSLPNDFPMVGYGDNLLVGGRTEKEMNANMRTLESALGAGSCGQFALASKEGRRRVDWGFEFLGYVIKFDRDREYIKPTKKNWRKFQLRSLVMSGKSGGVRQQRRLTRYVKAWRSSFALWVKANQSCWRWIRQLRSVDAIGSYMASGAEACLIAHARAEFDALLLAAKAG
jgi:hypothetical protein